MQCEQVQRMLLETGERDLPDLGARRHLESCLACQAEAVRYQKLLRALADLRGVYVEAPIGLLEDTLAVLDAVTGRRLAVLGRHRAAVAGALGAVAAGTAATIVFVARSRRRGLGLAS